MIARHSEVCEQIMAIIGFPNPVNEKAARVVAGLVATLGIVTLATRWWWLSGVLALGFAARVASGPRFDPFGRIATMVVAPRLGAPKLVAGPPKRFAQGIGLVLTVSALGAWLIGAAALTAALLGVLVGFALLEAAVGFCAGCRVFGHLMRFGVVPEQTCEACARRPGTTAEFIGASPVAVS